MKFCYIVFSRILRIFNEQSLVLSLMTGLCMGTRGTDKKSYCKVTNRAVQPQKRLEASNYRLRK